jgi:hypothetical protein
MASINTLNRRAFFKARRLNKRIERENGYTKEWLQRKPKADIKRGGNKVEAHKTAEYHTLDGIKLRRNLNTNTDFHSPKAIQMKITQNPAQPKYEWATLWWVTNE